MFIWREHINFFVYHSLYFMLLLCRFHISSSVIVMYPSNNIFCYCYCYVPFIPHLLLFSILCAFHSTSSFNVIVSTFHTTSSIFHITFLCYYCWIYLYLSYYIFCYCYCYVPFIPHLLLLFLVIWFTFHTTSSVIVIGNVIYLSYYIFCYCYW